ncbi:MAG: hypothetical protein FWE35_26965 [Streptosporangiales bacterium]|nr:hypothetical protein [Streptosporangiales bacterium]
MRSTSAGETVMVPRATVEALTASLEEAAARGYPLRANSRQAALNVAAAISRQDPDADAWLLDAEDAWQFWAASDALRTYGLDECADDTYKHPAVLAEFDLQYRIEEQAPRTDSAMTLLMNTELVILEALDGDE